MRLNDKITRENVVMFGRAESFIPSTPEILQQLSGVSDSNDVKKSNGDGIVISWQL